MDLQFRKLTGHFGVEVQGIDLSEPMSEATFAALDDAFNQNSLMLIRGQDVTPEQHIAFSSRWGTLEHHVLQLTQVI